MRDDWGFEEDDFWEEKEDPNICSQCGLKVPPSHLETDSGVCIACEDENNAIYDDDECSVHGRA